MNNDSGIPLKQLLVDGGMTVNNFLMQLQADVLGINVVKPQMAESTALGAAMAAGRAKGVECWNATTTEEGRDNKGSDCYKSFKPNITEAQREKLYSKWKEAVQRSFAWKK